MDSEYRQRLLGLHESSYLSLLSIVQGVAFGFLAASVHEHHSVLGLAGWLFVVQTFLVIVITWNEYVVAVAALKWVPDLYDASLPFLIAATEIWLAGTIASKPESWFLSFSVFCLVSFFAFLNMYHKANRENLDHNNKMLKQLGSLVLFSRYFPLLSFCVYVAFFLTGDLFTDWFLPLLSLLFLLAWVVRTTRYWNAVSQFAVPNAMETGKHTS